MNHSPILGHHLNSMGRNHHSHKCAFMEKLGNLEVEIERMGGKMDHEQKKTPICNKTLSEGKIITSKLVTIKLGNVDIYTCISSYFDLPRI